MQTWTREKWFVGIKPNTEREIFACDFKPTQKSHGGTYSAVIGPFRTKRGAIFMAEHGRGNPHCQHVDDAERLARLNG